MRDLLLAVMIDRVPGERLRELLLAGTAVSVTLRADSPETAAP